MYTIDELNIDGDLIVTEKDGFDIKTYFEDEFISPEDVGIEDKEDLQAIYDGELSWLILIVKAYKNGIELGSDSLGGCCYKDLNDLLDDYYKDLINNAVKEAKNNLKSLIKE